MSRRAGHSFTSRPFGCLKFPKSLRDRSEISGMPMASAALAEERILIAFIFSTWGLTGNLLWVVDYSLFACTGVFIPRCLFYWGV